MIKSRCQRLQEKNLSPSRLALDTRSSICSQVAIKYLNVPPYMRPHPRWGSKHGLFLTTPRTLEIRWCGGTGQSPEVAWQESTAARIITSDVHLDGVCRLYCASLSRCERRIVHVLGDTHWHPTQFWTSTVSCSIFPLIKVLDELTNIFIVFPAPTHSNNFQGTCTLPISTIRYRVLLRKRHRDNFTIP